MTVLSAPEPRNLAFSPSFDEETELRLQLIKERILCRAGIVISLGHSAMLLQALYHRAFELKKASIPDYLKWLEHSADERELARLISRVTVHTTSFFRDRNQMAMFASRVLPQLIARHPDETLRIWSAGCSTGEEPYSIAMLLARMGVRRSRVRLLATDISPIVLHQAEQARYPVATLTGMSEEERAFFQVAGEHCTVVKEIRDYVEFHFHNLVTPGYPHQESSPWDVIFCRNVLIYFHPATTRQIVNSLKDCLAEDGYLLLGTGESIFKIADGFQVQSGPSAFIHQKKTPQRAPPPAAPKKRVEPPAPSPQQVPFQRALAEATTWLEQGQAPRCSQAMIPLFLLHADCFELSALLGRAALAQERIDEAVAFFLHAVQIDSLDVLTRFYLAFCFYLQGMDQEAALQLQKVLFLRGDFGLSHYYLGLTSHRLGDLEKAHLAYRNALGILPAHPSSEDRQALALLTLTLEEAVQACQFRLQQLDPNS